MVICDKKETSVGVHRERTALWNLVGQQRVAVPILFADSICAYVRSYRERGWRRDKPHPWEVAMSPKVGGLESLRPNGCWPVRESSVGGMLPTSWIPMLVGISDQFSLVSRR
jgi:hypothetical protein